MLPASVWLPLTSLIVKVIHVGRKNQLPCDSGNDVPNDNKQRFDILQEESSDTKGVIRIPKSKKYRQHNGQKKRVKRTNNELQNIHIQLKIE